MKEQGQVQPRQNGAKRLLNRNGDALNTLFLIIVIQRLPHISG